MDKPGNLPGGIVSNIRNVHSRKLYIVSTAPEIGQDYWTTALFPVVENKALFGFVKKCIPDFYHQIVAFIRNSEEDAYEVHAQVRHVVSSQKKDDWFDSFPSLTPLDGYSEGAKKKLRSVLGYDAI